MEKTPNEIFVLMIQKLSGYISPEEDAWLTGLIHTDAQVKEKWENVQAAYREENVQSVLNNSADMLPREWLYPKQRKISFSIAAIWVSILLIVGAATFFIIRQRPPNTTANISQEKTPVNKSILLTLSNGQVINLSNQKDSSYAVGGMQLSSHDKVLSCQSNGMATGMNTLTVPIGLDYRINLPDGSIVYLNSATVLSFPSRFGDSAREITINGEAYLQVAHNVAKPFLVHLPHSTVRVLGTEFNVNSYDSGTVKIALVKGSVTLQTDAGKEQLKPGQQGIYRDHSLSVKPFNAETVLGWRQGIYYFDNATLRQITEVLPRWFGMQVQMDNEAKASEHFTGRVYRNQPITDFLDNLKSTTTVDYFIRDSVVHFR